MKKSDTPPKAIKMSESYFVLSVGPGRRALRINKILNGFYFIGGVDQQYSNSKGLSLEDFLRTMDRDALKKVAHFHKTDGVSKESLHKGLEELAKRKELDRYTHQRLRHMTRTCNCTAERLYYRLKNALGTERAHLVDKLDFRSENESMKMSLDDFDLWKKTLQLQGGKFIEKKELTNGK